MITIEQARSRVNEYIQSHPRGVRFLCLLAVLAVVWMQADNIESFTRGFFDGLNDSSQR